MFKKSCLALAAAALATGAAQADIVSIDYLSTVTGNIKVKGTIRWDTNASGTITNQGTVGRYTPTSVSLFVNDTDRSSSLSAPTIGITQTSAGQDDFLLSASLTSIPEFAGATTLLIDLFDQEGGIFAGVGSLPSSVSAFDGAEIKRVTFFGTSGLWSGTTTISPTAVTPSVPEPGSLLLVALAGLALRATRRHSTAA